MDGLLAAAGGGAEAIAPASGEAAWRSCSPRPSSSPARCRASTRSSTSSPRGWRRCGSRPRTWAGSCAATPTRSRREPGGSQEVEERLEHYDRLERKHGGSVAAVLEHAERCREPSASGCEQAEVATERAEAELGATRCAERDALAAELTAARREAAPRLAERVREELAELAMEGAAFEVELEPRDGDRRRAAPSGWS